MQHILLIGIGGFLGAISRHFLSIICHKTILTTFPIGTFIVNLVGAFIIGIIFGWDRSNPHLNSFLIIGLLGGFTTFSAFTAETVGLLYSNQILQAFLYIVLMISFSLLSTWGGITLIKNIV